MVIGPREVLSRVKWQSFDSWIVRRTTFPSLGR